MRSLSFGHLIADHAPPRQNIPLWYSYKSAYFTHVWPVGGGDGGFRVFRHFPQRSAVAVWSAFLSTPLEYYSVSHVFRVKFYVKVAFTKKQSKVVRRVWAYFSQRDSLLISVKSQRDWTNSFKRGPRKGVGGGGGGYSLKRWGKLFSRLFFGDSTITHMQMFHSHVNIIINLSSTLFWNIPSVGQLVRLKRRFTVRFSTTVQNNFCFYPALICFCFTVSPTRLSRFDLSCPLADSPRKEENEDRLQIQTPHFRLLPFDFVVEKLSKLQKNKNQKKMTFQKLRTEKW